MRSTLFVIPHEIGGWPLFGWGILFYLIVLAMIVWSATLLLSGQPLRRVLHSLPTWLVAAALVVFVLPAVEMRSPDGTPIGLPIRGYGVMVLLGLVAGIGLTIHRARRLGLEPDHIIALGFWMMLAGVAGARIFYVVQKWDEFAGGTTWERAVEILRLTEGGLVIYGGVIGGLVAAIAYCRRHGWGVLGTADLIAPGFLVGLAFGRIGCLLHGCCFGGVCTASLPAIQFPAGSAPYHTQLVSGQLLGLQLDHPRPPARVQQVAENSPASRAGIQPGEMVEEIRVFAADPADAPHVTDPPRLLVEIHLPDRTVTVLPEELAPRSLPVHPSQVYASINAALLAWLIWSLQPVPRRDGIVFCWAILLYAISRFVLEAIRSDELGQLGTSLTISQWISLVAGITAAIGLLWLRRRPPGRHWNWAPAPHVEGQGSRRKSATGGA